MKGGKYEIDQTWASILLIPFVKGLVERCINLGFQVSNKKKKETKTTKSIMLIDSHMSRSKI